MGRKPISRRVFIGRSVSGLAGWLYCSSRSGAQESQAMQRTPRERKLMFRTLGKTGIRVPIIGMGILNSVNPDLMRASLDAGITHFDTTAIQPQKERNEFMIGEVLRGRPRDSFVFGPKIHLPRNQVTGLYERGATQEDFSKSLDLTLRRLKMDYVDILYHHDVSRKEAALYEPVMKAMNEARRGGKTRFLGLTTHMNVAETVRAAADSGFYDIVMAAYNFRQRDRVEIKEAIARASSAGMGVIAIKAIRGELAEGEKPANARALLKWVLQDPHVHATVPAFSTFEEMDTDLSVMEDLDLTDAEKDDVKRSARLPDLFCQGCGRCLRQCPARIPIPALMRAYMYAYGYRQPGLARSVVNSLDLPSGACEGCSPCAVECLNRWDVGEKVRNVIRLTGLS